MKWRTAKLFVIVLAVWWWGLLIQSPPSEGLWKDVRCGLAYDETLGYAMPTNCTVVYRLYPDLGAWMYEFMAEPITGITQDW